jgi:hypothetical protein
VLQLPLAVLTLAWIREFVRVTVVGLLQSFEIERKNLGGKCKGFRRIGEFDASDSARINHSRQYSTLMVRRIGGPLSQLVSEARPGFGSSLFTRAVDCSFFV